MYKDPQETTSQPKVIKVHDLPPAHQASAKTKHKILFVPNRLNIYLSLLMDNKNVILMQKEAGHYSIP